MKETTNASSSRGQGLRILVFGTPGSGKTSLLGALWQAGKSQADALGGKIASADGSLAQLHEDVYNQKPGKKADGNRAGYPVSLEPENGEAINAVLVETDGLMTEDQLAQTGPVKGKAGGGNALRSADALVFLVDPTKGPAQFEKEFQQFCNFVQRLEKTRSQRTEVAGLPIYLVMTKCDAFGKSTDQEGVWLQKIDEFQRKMDKKLQDSMAKFPYPADLPFGKADVRVWSTAMKRPALADQPRAQEPFGVAELFRQCFESARDFQTRRRKSGERLQIVTLGFLGLIFLMLSAGGIFFVTRPSAEIAALEHSIHEVLPGQKGKSTDTLKEPLDERKAALEKILENSAFSKLTPEKQDEVKQAYQEIEQYVKASDQFDELFQYGVPVPKYAKGEKDLEKIEKQLALVNWPEKYEEAWKDTKLAKKKRQYQEDVANLRMAVAAVEAWYGSLVKQGKELRTEGFRIGVESINDPTKKDDWLKRVQAFFTSGPLAVAERDKLMIAKFTRPGSEEKDAGAAAARQQKLTELLNVFGPQQVWVNPKTREICWLLGKDLAVNVHDVPSLEKVIRAKLAELEKTGSDKELKEKFARHLENLKEYSFSVSISPSITYATVNRFDKVDRARKELEQETVKLKKQQDTI